MQIQLFFFAGIREVVGLSGEVVELPGYVDTIGAVRAFLVARGGVWAAALHDNPSLRMAYNKEMAIASTPIANGGELAFFPPVTGG